MQRAEDELARQIARQLAREEAVRQRGSREGLWAGFVAVFGHLEYEVLMSDPFTRWRTAYRRHAACEIRGCTTGSPKMVFDHCHRHGWIRGALCGSHNTRLGYVESVMNLEGVSIDLTGTCYGPHLANCPGCSGTVAVKVPPELFTLEPDEAIVLPRAVVLPKGKAAHLPRSLERTWCGLP